MVYQNLKNAIQAILVFKVPIEKSGVILMVFLLFVTWHFSIASFIIFFFVLYIYQFYNNMVFKVTFPIYLMFCMLLGTYRHFLSFGKLYSKTLLKIFPLLLIQFSPSVSSIHMLVFLQYSRFICPIHGIFQIYLYFYSIFLVINFFSIITKRTLREICMDPTGDGKQTKPPEKLGRRKKGGWGQRGRGEGQVGG